MRTYLTRASLSLALFMIAVGFRAQAQGNCASFDLDYICQNTDYVQAVVLDCGLESMSPDVEIADAQTLLKYSQQVKTLTLPSEMGERFKVMAV